jgi:hypothetical protein
MRRESSQQSHNSKSPGSVGEQQPLRHTVKPARHTKIVLPRNHGSARNLQKLQRQTQQAQHAAEDGRPKNSRQRSYDGDNEIRLPGSLDESRPAPMKRNMTAYQLPRNTSHTKLKKNLSHGQLTRLGSGKNLAALNAKAPLSPGLKGRKKRPKSADFGKTEKDLHEQEIELAQQIQERKQSGGKRVGFAVGSEGDSDADDVPQMEGSGLQEDEWTDQSASASPFSTRQNTANNSRRASMILDKPPDKPTSHRAHLTAGDGQLRQVSQEATSESKFASEQLKPIGQNGEVEGESEDEDADEPPSPRSTPQVKKRGNGQLTPSPHSSSHSHAAQRSPLHAAKDMPNYPGTHRILSRTPQNPAPALVSNVSALDVNHSNSASPAPSLRSSKSNLGELDDELVSRFIPSTSHPSTGSGGNTTVNTPGTTPKDGNLQTPENDSSLNKIPRSKTKVQFGPNPAPISPDSTISGSSGAATPAVTRSRTELRMLTDKALAEREDAARFNPVIPPHVFDRNNVSLKSYTNLESLGGDGRGGLDPQTGLCLRPELFQGRFKAINTELKVVQRFRDPIAESIERLKKSQGSKFTELRRKKPTPSEESALPRMPVNKSTPNLPKQGSRLSTSASPPKSASPAKSALANSTQMKRGSSQRGRVTFSQEPEKQEVERQTHEPQAGPDAIAKLYWDSL